MAAAATRLECSWRQAMAPGAPHGASLRHRFIVRFYGAYLSWENHGSLCVLLQYAGGGTLERAISMQARRGDGFETEWATRTLSQLASALDYMHGCGVIQVFFGAVVGPAVAAADQ